ncbi:MAG: SpoIIE family protein phosphatase [Planctomycetes bacterium]|nr:SpoIIE family protein phosphatase [Planctomycetota bacterium]
MSVLIILHGPDTGQHFALNPNRTILGRNTDCDIPLTGKQVSRQHAHIDRRDARYYLQDLGSSNGTYLNGKRLTPHVSNLLTDRDTFQLGPYLFGLRTTAPSGVTEADSPVVVREMVSATSVNERLFAQDPAAKLQVVLEISQHLARTLEVEPLLDKLLEQLTKLLPQADRFLVILCEGDQLVLRAQRTRKGQDLSSLSFSRTIVQRALKEGVGLLSDDLQSDHRYQASHSITSLDLHSIICVPLINQDGHRLGVIQVDRLCQGFGFRVEDLHLVTAIGMQVAVVLENVALHAEQLREQRLRQELALAQEIQQGYLPDELEGFPSADFEIHGHVFPARQVAGDFYDFVKAPSGQLAFFIGDVSGKGMPAALYMIAVRTLCRHLVKETTSPAQLFPRLNAELAAENPTCMFVTLEHGRYEPATGRVQLSSAGHPPPFLRRADGTVESVALRPGRLLGFDVEPLVFPEVMIELAPGDALFFFTDGFFEARESKERAMFGLERIRAFVSGCTPGKSLADCTEAAKALLDDFTSSKDLQDDLTLLILRRRL